MISDQDQWTAIVVVVLVLACAIGSCITALVLACAIGCSVRNVLDRVQSEVYVLEEDPET